MKSTLMDRVDAAKYSYVGRRACGCVTSMCVDVPGDENGTARFVRDLIADLVAVERVTIAEGRKLIQAGVHTCGKQFLEMTAASYHAGYKVKDGDEITDRKFTAVARRGRNYLVIRPDELAPKPTALKPIIEGV